jgi:hypothetical protein
MRLREYGGRPNPTGGDRHVEKASTLEATGGDAAAPRDESVDDECYRLISIDAVRAPQGCSGSDWHVYRIVQGDNEITGYRRGDLARVRTDVETIVTALNGRRQWTKGKAPSPSQRRAAAAAARAAAK